MKKTTLMLGIAFLVLAFNSCKKEKTTKTFGNTESKMPKGEITFIPNSKTEASTLVKSFLAKTNYAPIGLQRTRDGQEDINVQTGAWLFEAGANYVENVHCLKETSSETISITINKSTTNSDLLDGTDLISKYNSFMNTISTKPSLTPLLINVKDLNETGTELNFMVDVKYSDGDPLPTQINWPTVNKNSCDAADALTQNISQYYLDYYSPVVVISTNPYITANSAWFYNVVNIPNSFYVDFDLDQGQGITAAGPLWRDGRYGTPGNNIFDPSLYSLYFQNAKNFAWLKCQNVSPLIVPFKQEIQCGYANGDNSIYPIMLGPVPNPPYVVYFEGYQHGFGFTTGAITQMYSN